jgi:hypothetical protein
MELEQPDKSFEVPPDARPRIPEPPPVSLIAVADVSLPSVCGMERELDAFYVGLLRFERDLDVEQITYRAENFRLRFGLCERRPNREGVRPVGIAIENFTEITSKLIEEQIEYTLQRGLTPGEHSVLLRDPAGNWIELFDRGLASGF